MLFTLRQKINSQTVKGLGKLFRNGILDLKEKKGSPTGGALGVLRWFVGERDGSLGEVVGGKRGGGGKAGGTMFEIGLGGRVGRGGGGRLEWKPIFTNLNFFVFHPQALRILVIDRLKGTADGVVRRSLPGWWYFTWLDWLFYICSPVAPLGQFE